MVNMWCAHTLMLTKAMQTVAPTITGYPKIGLRENTGIISETNAKARNNQDVDLWMPKDPEKVHPQSGRAARLRIKEMPAQIAVDEQHDLSRG